MRANNSVGRIILYGAVVDVPDRPSYGLKHYVRRFVDKTAFRLGYVHRLDYRNHLDGHTHNRGDHSIIVAMKQRIRAIERTRCIVAVQWGRLEAAGLTSRDKVLICGSGYFFPDQKGRLPDRIFSDYRAIETSGCEVHFVGVGYNRILAWRSLDEQLLLSESRQMLRKMLDRAATLTVRDGNTKRVLSNFTNRSIRVVGDPALFIEAPALAVRGVKERCQPRVGLNVPFHGPQSTMWVRKNLRQFVGAIKRIETLTGCRFTYFVHYDTELLIADILRSQGIRLDVVNLISDRLPREYAGVDVHIGGMLHSCILATAAGVPSVGLAYDEKHYGFFDLMQRPEFCLNANQFDEGELVDKTIELLADESGEARSLAGRRRDLSIEFDSQLRAVMFASPSLAKMEEQEGVSIL